MSDFMEQNCQLEADARDQTPFASHVKSFLLPLIINKMYT